MVESAIRRYAELQVPRTSNPTAADFSNVIGPRDYASWLSRLEHGSGDFDGSHKIVLIFVRAQIRITRSTDRAWISLQSPRHLRASGGDFVFQQLLTPVGGSLGLSFIVATLPIVAVLVLLGVLRRPALQAALAGLVVGLIVAVAVWQMPLDLALNSVANGAVFALWPVMWIVVNALLLYNIAVRSGRFDAFRNWVVSYLPNDRRIVLVVVGFCFGALLEGIAGFGTPVAITSSLLILVGYPPLEALVFVLDLQYGAGGFRCSRRAGDRAWCRHWSPGDSPRRDDRPAVAVDRAHAAVLCHGFVWRVALGARSLAGLAGCGRQLCDHRNSSRRTSLTIR